MRLLALVALAAVPSYACSPAARPEDLGVAEDMAGPDDAVGPEAGADTGPCPGDAPECAEECERNADCDDDRCCALGDDEALRCRAYDSEACSSAADQCLAGAPPSVPVAQCRWRGPRPGQFPGADNASRVTGNVVVADLGLTDAEGRPSPSVVFAASDAIDVNDVSFLWVLSGRDCSVQLAPVPLGAIGWQVSVAEMDGAFPPEILVDPGRSNTLEVAPFRVLEVDRSVPELSTRWSYDEGTSVSSSAFLIRDLIDDERPEIFLRNALLRADGSEVFAAEPQPRRGVWLVDRVSSESAVQSVETSGLYSPTATGWVLDHPLPPPGSLALTGNYLHFHPRARFATQGTEGLEIRDQEGSILWATNLGLGLAGQAAAADLDGDGELEVVVTMVRRLPLASIVMAYDSECFERDAPGCSGTTGVRWETEIGGTFTVTVIAPPKLFDFDGDGAVEVIVEDGCSMSALDGATGERRWIVGGVSEPRPGRLGGGPVIADTDADGRAEIVAPYAFYPDPSLPDTALCPDLEALPVGFACDVRRPCPSAEWRCVEGECVATSRQEVGIAIYRDRLDRWAPTDSAWTHPNHRPGAFDEQGMPLSRMEWTPAWRDPDDQGFRVARSLGPLEATDPAPDLTVRRLSEWDCTRRRQTLRAAVCNRGGAEASRRLRATVAFVTPGDTRELCSVPVETDLAPGECTDVDCIFSVGDAQPPDVTATVLLPEEATGVECEEANNGTLFSAEACRVE